MAAARAGAFGGVTVREALDSAVIAIAAAGSQTPRLDAEVLLADVLGVDRLALLTDSRRPVEGPAVRAFQDAVRRRSVGREPVAYITRRRGFRHLELEVDPRVLVPRPETELLVEVGVELLALGARVVDVGTGSGAIALALKQERPDLDVIATDVSADALAVARANAVWLGLDGVPGGDAGARSGADVSAAGPVPGHGVRFLEGDLLAGAQPVDAVLSNPPYVAEHERALLAPEIVRHEPPGALFAGEDGLDVIRRLIPAAADAGARLIAIEAGAGQADAVAALMREHGFPETAKKRDLAGIERVIIGSR